MVLLSAVGESMGNILTYQNIQILRLQGAEDSLIGQAKAVLSSLYADIAKAQLRHFMEMDEMSVSE